MREEGLWLVMYEGRVLGRGREQEEVDVWEVWVVRWMSVYYWMGMYVRDN